MYRNRIRGASVGRAGQRVMEGISRFIADKLKLKVNSSKSAVDRPSRRKFLGVSFTGGKNAKRRIAPKAIDRFTELRKRGVGKDLAAQTTGSCHGPWRLAKGPALSIALPNRFWDWLDIPRVVGNN